MSSRRRPLRRRRCCCCRLRVPRLRALQQQDGICGLNIAERVRRVVSALGEVRQTRKGRCSRCRRARRDGDSAAAAGRINAPACRRQTAACRRLQAAPARSGRTVASGRWAAGRRAEPLAEAAIEHRAVACMSCVVCRVGDRRWMASSLLGAVAAPLAAHSPPPRVWDPMNTAAVTRNGNVQCSNQQSELWTVFRQDRL